MLAQVRPAANPSPRPSAAIMPVRNKAMQAGSRKGCDCDVIEHYRGRSGQHSPGPPGALLLCEFSLRNATSGGNERSGASTKGTCPRPGSSSRRAVPLGMVAAMRFIPSSKAGRHARRCRIRCAWKLSADWPRLARVQALINNLIYLDPIVLRLGSHPSADPGLRRRRRLRRLPSLPKWGEII